MMTLYDYELSGNCYKVRLMLSMLGIPCETRVVEFYPAAEHKQQRFLQINPMGTLPVLCDAELTLTDSSAILVYLAMQHDTSKQWYPAHDAEATARITQWLAFAESLTTSAGTARLINGFFYEQDLQDCQQRAHRLLRILDEHLWFAEKQRQHWLVPSDHPSIADIACFPYIILCEEGGISQQDYPAVRRWCDRVKHISGFIVMPGVFPAGPVREGATRV
ncbi:MAG: glutathione S-transferase family protein [Granulosicoccus sp.]